MGCQMKGYREERQTKEHHIVEVKKKILYDVANIEMMMSVFLFIYLFIYFNGKIKNKALR